MALTVGSHVWIPCQVKPGPFSDERMVLVDVESDSWLGFVPVSWLSDTFEQGSTFIRAVVAGIVGDSFTARLPGHALTPRVFRGSVGRAVALAPTESPGLRPKSV